MSVLNPLEAPPTTLTRYRLTEAGEFAISEAEVERMAGLAFARARRTLLLEQLIRMRAAPLEEAFDQQLYDARADAVMALDRKITELESGA